MPISPNSRLAIGFKAFQQANDSKYDLTIYYSAKGSLAMEAMLDPEEADDFPLVRTLHSQGSVALILLLNSTLQQPGSPWL